MAARYEYAPFGELLRATGVFCDENPYRFSSRFMDVETGLIYYGYRYYNPRTGQWISRDPSAEKSGLRLYAFLKNSPVHGIDVLGKFGWMEGIGEVDRLLNEFYDTVEMMQAFEVGSPGWMALSKGLNMTTTELVATADASYTASGAYTVYGATGLTGAGATVSLATGLGLAIAAAYIGYEIGTELAEVRLSDDKTVSDQLGDYLYDAYSAVTGN